MVKFTHVDFWDFSSFEIKKQASILKAIHLAFTFIKQCKLKDVTYKLMEVQALYNHCFT